MTRSGEKSEAGMIAFGTAGAARRRQVGVGIVVLALVSTACGGSGEDVSVPADEISAGAGAGAGDGVDADGSTAAEEGDDAGEQGPGNGPLGRRDRPGADDDAGEGTSEETEEAEATSGADPQPRDPIGADCPECVADFALYDPPGESDGVWTDEVTALITAFEAFGFTYERVANADIVSGGLGEGNGRRYRALVAPGGWAWTRNQAVTPQGDEHLRSFVASGGNYLGFCAGAYWAADVVVFAEWDPTDYTEYPQYDLELLPGPATGPFAWTPWNNGSDASLQVAAIDTSTPVMQAAGMPAQTRFFYGGGPFFPDLSGASGVEVWARAVKPAGTPDSASNGDGQPTVIRSHFGSGNVVLFSYHPEILIDSMVDGVVLRTYYPERQMTWDTGDQTMDEVNLDSWNIVHAALQVAANTEVTPLTELPG